MSLVMDSAVPEIKDCPQDLPGNPEVPGSPALNGDDSPKPDENELAVSLFRELLFEREVGNCRHNRKI